MTIVHRIYADSQIFRRWDVHRYLLLGTQLQDLVIRD